MNYSGSSCSSSSSSDDETDTDNQPKAEEELVTRLQLRLSASHLPRVGRLKLTRRSPDTFASVTSIFHKDGAKKASSHLSSTAFSFDSARFDKEYMVEWGSTEIIRNSKSPKWISTIPLKYELGSECFFYVRIMQAEPTSSSSTTSNNTSPIRDSQNNNNNNSSSLSCSESGSFGGGGGGSSPEKNNKKFHVFGTALFEVGDILGSHNYTKVKRLKAGGCVYAKIEPFQGRDEFNLRFRFQFQALNLLVDRSIMKKRFNLGAEPTTVLEIARPHDSPSLTSWVTVFRSRPVLHSNSPQWDLAELDLKSCCRKDDLSGVIRLSVYRVKKAHKQTLVGLCETTMHNILANAQTGNGGGGDGRASENDFYLQKNMRQLRQVGQLRVKVACLVTQSGRIYSGPSSSFSAASQQQSNPSSPINLSSSMSIDRTESNDSTTTNGGDDPFNVDLRQMSLRRFGSGAVAAGATFSPRPSPAAPMTLHDFVDGGGQLDFAVAIDFTSSNGSPLQPGTLHFQSDEALNDYEETITSIGNAVDKYSSLSDYCVWGFGAKFDDGVVRHLFQCGQQPTVNGVRGILDAYRSVFRSGGIYMSGPTVFVKAIQAAAVRARKNKMAGAKTYTILLIVTDGIMDSSEETKEKLSVYSEVPLSVVIVGVGRHDFRSMYALCDFPHPSASRKNITFVEFRNHQHDPRSLAQAALGQIPQQLSEYLAAA